MNEYTPEQQAHYKEGDIVMLKEKLNEKAILLSIKPKWVAKILNGEKTIEIRKKFPKDYRGWIYIYCTKDKEKLYDDCPNMCSRYKSSKRYILNDFLNGKVVARFWCDKVECIWKTTTSVWLCENEISDKLYKGSCLSDIELDRYFKPEKLGVNYRYGHAIHISDLEIFDEPKELSEFRHYKDITMIKKRKEHK